MEFILCVSLSLMNFNENIDIERHWATCHVIIEVWDFLKVNKLVKMLGLKYFQSFLSLKNIQLYLNFLLQNFREFSNL